MSENSKRTQVGGLNPYSPTAVALVTELHSGTITIPTHAVKEAFQSLDAYLNAAPATPGPGKPTGRVIAIVGEYGTGKTHLAAALHNRVQDRPDPTNRQMYVEAPAGTFIKLYQRFVSQLDRCDIEELVRDYYADVVADDLGPAEETQSIATGLRAGQLDPAEVVQDFGLMDSVLLRQLRGKLIDIVRDDDIGTALTLLLESKLESAVWDWLGGHRAGEFLAERGITRQIDSEDAALTAIAAFALLYGYRRHRFVLVFDEFDKVLAAVSRLSGDPVGAFRSILTLFESSGAFVVLSGLSDMLQGVAPDVVQRISRVITMPPMSSADIRRFVRESHLRTLGHERLDPFTEDALDYLGALTNGVPRQLIKLCHHLYRQATDEGGQVSVQMVQDVARDHFDFASVADVRREVPKVLHREGVRFSRSYLLDTAGEPLIDFWVTGIDGDARCAILISESVLTSNEVAAVAQRVSAARAEAEDLEIVLVVVGYLANEVAPELARTLGTDPLVYMRRSFDAQLAAMVSAVLRRLDALHTTDPVDVIRERVERINRQQASTQALVEQLAAHVTTMRDSSEHQLTALRRELADFTRYLGPPQTTGAQVPRAGLPASPVPAPVDELFHNALQTVGKLNRVEELLEAAFATDPDPVAGVDAGQPGAIGSARAVIRTRLHQQDGFVPLGATIFLRQLIETFRGAVGDWYRRTGGPNRSGVLTRDLQAIDTLCQTYDSIYEYVPLYQLKKLAESTARYSDRDDRIEGIAWPTMHLDDIRSAFDGLGAQVRRAVQASVPPQGTPGPGAGQVAGEPFGDDQDTED